MVSKSPYLRPLHLVVSKAAIKIGKMGHACQWLRLLLTDLYPVLLYIIQVEYMPILQTPKASPTLKEGDRKLLVKQLKKYC